MHFTDSSLETANGEFESFYLDNQKKVLVIFYWVERMDYG